MSALRLLVTRPQPQADEWAAALRERGVPGHALPLIAIAPVADAAVKAAWDTLAAHRMLVFVSPNCVQSFFALRPSGMPWPDATWAGATGPGTAQALREDGAPPAAIVEPAHDAPQFDSEALWQRLQDQPWQGRRVLIVRGDGGRDWLAERLSERGAQVAFVQAYRRVLPVLSAPQRALLADAQATPGSHWWLFSSSQSVDHLLQLSAQSDWSSGCALATHERIAQTLRERRFGSVLSVRPTLDAVVDAWTRSIQSTPASDQRP